MSTKKPLCNYAGSVQEMASTDILYSAKIYHGIESAGALSFDNSSHVLTIASGTNTYWYQGVKYTTASAITCDLDDYITLADNTLYYVYFDDATGTLKSGLSMNLKTRVPVCMVYWNGSEGAVTNEKHNHTRNLDWHINAHRTIGTSHYNGLDLTAPTTSNDATLTITGGTIYDEDIEHVITEQTACRVFYLASANKYTFANYSLPYPGTSGAPQYLDTDTYALAAVGSNKFVCYWVYATPDISRPIYIIPSALSAAYNTIALARTETPPALFGFNLTPEMKLIYRFIYNGDGNFQEAEDYRKSSSLPSGYIASTTAAAVSFTPSGNVAATNVQTAIEELDTEKSATSHTHSDATTSVAGFMSATDKTKLDGLSGGVMTYQVISTNTNATKNNGYLINASSGNVTLTLPGSPSAGDTVGVVDAYGKATTNTITIARNGSKISGLDEDLVIDINGSGLVLVYADSTIGWVNSSEIGMSIPTYKYFGAVFDGGGYPIIANKKAYVRIPTSATITKAYIIADVSGTISIEVWKDTFANFPPTVADKISASAPIALSSAQSGEDTTLTGWTKTITEGDVICFNVSALATSITWCAVGVVVQ